MPSFNSTKSFGKMVTLRREAKGLSQTELGKKITVKSGGPTNPSAISAYEKGKRSPTLEMVDKYAEALECDPVDLISNKPVLENVDPNRLPLIAALLSAKPETFRLIAHSLSNQFPAIFRSQNDKASSRR